MPYKTYFHKNNSFFIEAKPRYEIKEGKLECFGNNAKDTIEVNNIATINYG